MTRCVSTRCVSRVLLVLSLLVAMLAPATPSAFGQTPTADETTGLSTVRAAYGDLLDLFYKPLEPRGLLEAGWASLAAEAQARGAPSPPPLGPLPDGRDEAFAAFASAYDGYVHSLPSTFPTDAAAGAVAAGMAESPNEAHTHYLPPSAFRAFLTAVGGGQQAIGLGIRLGKAAPGLVVDVAPQGPADRAGVRPGDVITGADGTDLSTVGRDALARALAGPAGSTVKLTIDRGNGPQSISVTRGAYYFAPLDSRLLPGDVGYLRLADFVAEGSPLPNGTEILSDLDHRLDQLDAAGARGLILDLRDNGGGSVMTADELLGRFLPESAVTLRNFDEHGHESFELAGGVMRSRQLPMAVLVNGGSASASEIAASSLHDAHRAVLVGQQTAGAVAGSELLPVPGGSALQIAVSGVTTSTGSPLDGVGVPVDVTIGDTRTTADYRAGRDPQLDAAVNALATAPAPPAIQSTPTGVSSADLDRLVGGLLPTPEAVPTNDRLTQTTPWGRQDFTHPNELIDADGGGRDPLALQRTFRARGYQGSVTQSYGASPGDEPMAGVEVDLYATADGAHEALATNDFPDMQTAIDSTVQLGDETVAYRGTWLAQGATGISWRRGRMVLTVGYSDVPGFERPDTLTTLAQLVDGLAQQTSLP